MRSEGSMLRAIETKTLTARLRQATFTRVKVPAPGTSSPPALPTGGIHVGAFGYTNSDWILRPLGAFRVQQFRLLEMPGHDKARAMLASKGIDIDAELARVVKRVDRTEVDLWDPGSVAGVLVGAADALEAENQGPLWANISTGPN